MKIRKLLIVGLFPATMAGCASPDSDWSGILGGSIPKSLDALPFVYKPEVQQGNVVTQEMVNQLKPGMLKRQVQFTLGTPMLADVFHNDRWDYYYSVEAGTRVEALEQTRAMSVDAGEDQRRHIVLFFENDRLARIEGDLKPGDAADPADSVPDQVVSVPDWEPEEKTLFGKALSVFDGSESE